MASSGCVAAVPARPSGSPSRSRSAGKAASPDGPEQGGAARTVLLVEDEDSLRATLARFLGREGYRVIAAADAREAFDLGLRARPDFLIVDWMLRNDLHGLHVSEVLRGVHASLRTILITGFPSRDLQGESERRGVTELLEKPFDLETLRTALESAAELEPPRGRPLAVIEVDGEGRVVFASPRARALAAETSAGPDPERIEDLIGPEADGLLEEARRRWLQVQPRGSSESWLVRSHPLEQGWRLVVCPDSEKDLTRDSRVRMLLHEHARPAPTLDHSHPVVLVENDASLRRLLVSQIERVGFLCYPADDLRSALRLLEAEPRVRQVFVDFDGISGEPDAWVRALRAQAQEELEVVAVGSVRADGVRILAKPWRIGDLLGILGRPD